MKRIYEFKCRTCEQVFDKYHDESERIVACACGGLADRIFSVPYFKEDITSDRWVKNRRSHMKKERRNMENHGTYD